MKLTQEMARMILTRRSVDRLILAARTLCVLVLIALVANGCASFAGQRLPTVDSIPSRAHFTNKPSVYFALRFVSDLSGGRNPPIEHAEPLPTMREIVDRVATQSGLFRSHTFESFQAGTTDYTFQLEMLNHGSIGAAVGAGLITGLTLFMVPSATTDKYTLTAKVFDRSGQLLKTYTYDDEITTWFGIWLLPLAGKTPMDAVTRTWENMFRTFLRDLTQDTVLPYSLSDPSRDTKSLACGGDAARIGWGRYRDRSIPGDRYSGRLVKTRSTWSEGMPSNGTGSLMTGFGR